MKRLASRNGSVMHRVAHLCLSPSLINPQTWGAPFLAHVILRERGESKDPLFVTRQGWESTSGLYQDLTLAQLPPSVST